MSPGRPATRVLIGLTLLLSPLGAPLARTAAAADDQPVVVLETSMGAITLQLDRTKAPITVDNFLRYVDDHYYDNLIFHRVIPDFMVQGGGMDDRLVEKPTRGPIKNESGNGLSNTRGTIAMARTNNPNSATSQFFINLFDKNRFLDTLGGGYTVFGKVISGMDVVDAIAKVPTASKLAPGNPMPMEDVPVKPVYIKSARRKTKS